MRNAKVRQALALATNREGYVTALGGAGAATEAYTLIGPSLPGHSDADPGRRSHGDTARGEGGAAGVRPDPAGQGPGGLPVDARSPTRRWPRWSTAGAGRFRRRAPADRRTTSRGVQAGPRRPDRRLLGQLGARLAVRLHRHPAPVRQPHQPVRQRQRRDFGGFADKAVNAEITRIGRCRRDRPRRCAWAALDASLAKRAVFVALAQRRALYVAGSWRHRAGGQRGTGRVRRPRHPGCRSSRP